MASQTPPLDILQPMWDALMKGSNDWNPNAAHLGVDAVDNVSTSGQISHAQEKAVDADKLLIMLLQNNDAQDLANDILKKGREFGKILDALVDVVQDQSANAVVAFTLFEEDCKPFRDRAEDLPDEPLENVSYWTIRKIVIGLLNTVDGIAGRKYAEVMEEQEIKRYSQQRLRDFDVD